MSKEENKSSLGIESKKEPKTNLDSVRFGPTDNDQRSEASVKHNEDTDSISKSSTLGEPAEKSSMSLACSMLVWLFLLISGFGVLTVIIFIGIRIDSTETDNGLRDRNMTWTEKPLVHYIGDGICDDVTNTLEHLFDGNDCCNIDCQNRTSTQAQAFCNCRECKCFGALCDLETGNCTDIDECQTEEFDSDTCPGWAMCVNTMGSFFCQCPQGFTTVNASSELDNVDVQCQDIDECQELGSLACPGMSECLNGPGTYDCLDMAVSYFSDNMLTLSEAYSIWFGVRSKPSADNIDVLESCVVDPDKLYDRTQVAHDIGVRDYGFVFFHYRLKSDSKEVEGSYLLNCGGVTFLKKIASNSCHKLSLESGKVEKLASMIVGRSKFTLTNFNGVLYAVGGKTITKADSSTIEVYDIPKNTWTLLSKFNDADVNNGIEQHCTVAYRQQLFIIGGQTFEDEEGDYERYQGFVAYNVTSGELLNHRDIIMKSPMDELSCSLVNSSIVIAVGLHPIVIETLDLAGDPGPVTLVQALDLSDPTKGWTMFPPIRKWWRNNRHLASLGRSLILWGGAVTVPSWTTYPKICSTTMGKENIALFDWQSKEWDRNGLFKPGYDSDLEELQTNTAFARVPSKFFDPWCHWMNATEHLEIAIHDPESGMRFFYSPYEAWSELFITPWMEEIVEQVFKGNMSHFAFCQYDQLMTTTVE